MGASLTNCIVRNYLNSFLEIDEDKTQASILSGTLELENVKVKNEVFLYLDIPYLELIHGFIGSITFKINLPFFWKYPIEIIIKQVFAHCRYKNEEGFDEERLVRSIERAKKNKLETIEEIRNHFERELQDQSGMSSIVKMLIRNTIVRISEVFVLIQDNLGIKNNSCSTGIILKSVELGGKKITESSESSNEGISKEIKANDMSIFIDNSATHFQGSNPYEELVLYSISILESCSQEATKHHYILYDFYFTGLLVLQDSALHAQISCKDFFVNVETRQVTLILKFLDYSDLFNFFKKGVELKYYNKLLTLEEKRYYMKKYLDIYRLKYVLKENPKSEQFQELERYLSDFEENLTYHQIQSMRDAAIVQLKYDIDMYQVQKDIHSLENKSSLKKLFTYKSDSAELSKLKQEQKVLDQAKGKCENAVKKILVEEEGVIKQDFELRRGNNDEFSYTIEIHSDVSKLSIGEDNCQKNFEFFFGKALTRLELTNDTTFQLASSDFTVKQYKNKDSLIGSRLIEKVNDKNEKNVGDFLFSYHVNSSSTYYKIILNLSQQLRLYANGPLFLYINKIMQQQVQKRTIKNNEISLQVKRRTCNVISTGRNYQNLHDPVIYDLHLSLNRIDIVIPHDFKFVERNNFMILLLNRVKLTTDCLETLVYKMNLGGLHIYIEKDYNYLTNRIFHMENADLKCEMKDSTNEAITNLSASKIILLIKEGQLKLLSIFALNAKKFYSNLQIQSSQLAQSQSKSRELCYRENEITVKKETKYLVNFVLPGIELTLLREIPLLGEMNLSSQLDSWHQPFLKLNFKKILLNGTTNSSMTQLNIKLLISHISLKDIEKNALRFSVSAKRSCVHSMFQHFLHTQESNNSKCPSSIAIHYEFSQFSSDQDKMKIRLYVSNIKFCPNLSVVKRIHDFIFRVKKVLDEYYENLPEEAIEEELAMKQKQLGELTEQSGINRQFVKGVIKKLKTRSSASSKEKESEIPSSRPSFDKSQSRQFKPLSEIIEIKSNDEQAKEQTKITYTVLEIRMTDFELIFPFDETTSNTYLFKLCFDFQSYIKQLEDFLAFQENNEERIKYFKKDITAMVYLNKVFLDLQKIPKEDNDFFDDFELPKFRISSKIKSCLHLEDQSQNTQIDVAFESISAVVGIGKLVSIQKYFKRISDFFLMIQQQKEKYNHNYKNKLVKELKKIEKKVEKKSKYNIEKFNKYFEVNLKLDKCSLELIDDEATFFKPQGLIEVSKFSVKYVTNSDPGDSHNMGVALVEIIGGKNHVEEYNVQNLHQYCQASLWFRMSFFNDRVNSWEPILEPWNTQFKLMQVHPITRRKMKLLSEQILNLNITFYGLQTINAVLTRIQNLESKNNQQVSRRKSDQNEFNQSNPLQNDTYLEVVNKTGVDVIFWMEADPKTTYELKTKESRSFSLEKLQEIHLKLEDTDPMRLKKNKLAFHIFPSVTFPSEDVDFSFNHYSIRKVFFIKKIFPEHDDYRCYHPHKYFEVTIKIKNSGKKKVVCFESNLTIHNNTKFKVSLSGMQYHNCIKNDNPYAKYQVPSKIVLEPESFEKVPLPWLIFNYDLFAYIENDPQVSMKSQHVYRDLDFIYSLGEEYKDLNVAISTEHIKEKIVRKLSKRHCRIALFNGIYLAFDLLMLKSSNELYEPFKETFFKRNRAICFNYMIVINAPIRIENSIPCPSVFSYSNQKIPLAPLQVENLYDLTFKKQNDLMILINGTYESKYFSFQEKLEHHKFKREKIYNSSLNPKKRDDTNNYEETKEVQLKVGPVDLSTIYNFNYLQIETFCSLSKKITFYFYFLIVNRADIKLFLQNTDCCNNIVLPIPPHDITLLSLPSDNTSVKLKTEFSKWSDNFDINTPGVEGVTNLRTNLLNQKGKKETYRIDIASKIFQSKKFDLSTVVLLEPRFLVVNHFEDLRIKYRHVFLDDLKYDPICELSPLSKRIFTFSEDKKHMEREKIKQKGKKDKTEKIYFQFCLAFDNFDIPITNEFFWSPIFDVNKTEDFNVKIPLPQGMPLHNMKGKYVFTYDSIQYYFLVRVTIHSVDNALVYIIISHALNPQFYIQNKTEYLLEIQQQETQAKVIFPPKSEAPFTYSNLTLENKKIDITICNKNLPYSFHKLRRPKSLKLSNGTVVYFSTSFKNKDTTRILKIQTEEEIKGTFKATKEYFFAKKGETRTMTVIDIRGFGVSIVDPYPREILYLSLYKIRLIQSNYSLKSAFTVEKTDNIELYVNNVQIDYCLDDSFKFIILPQVQLLEKNENQLAVRKEKGENVNVTPFIQLLVTIQRIQNLHENFEKTNIQQVDFIMQEVSIKFDQSVLHRLMALNYSMLGILDFYKERKQSKSLKGKQKQTDENLDKELKEEDFCICKKEELRATVETVGEIFELLNDDNAMFIDALMLSALHLRLTLRIDITSLDIPYFPRFLISIFGPFGNSLSRITNAPLRFTEVIIRNTFINISKIKGLLRKHYMQQALVQLYTILGSSDLIGNPVAILGNVGTGFNELFNPPRKNFNQGPIGFGKGLEKGADFLLTKIVGSGLEFVSRITGTLYSASKNVVGEKIQIKDEEEPENVVEGAIKGGKIFGKEIARRCTGLVLTPYYMSKRGGSLGLLKGIEKGILGFIMMPITSTLGFTNSFVLGLKNNTYFLSKGKLKSTRFRIPRYIAQNLPMVPYDLDPAKVKAALAGFRNYEKFQDNLLMYYTYFQSLERNFRKTLSLLVLTEKRLVMIYGENKKMFDYEIAKIVGYEVYITGLCDVFLHVFYLVDINKIIPVKILIKDLQKSQELFAALGEIFMKQNKHVNMLCIN